MIAAFLRTVVRVNKIQNSTGKSTTRDRPNPSFLPIPSTYHTNTAINYYEVLMGRERKRGLESPTGHFVDGTCQRPAAR